MQLTSLLEEAQGATPDRRILFRDQIAPFGTRAIEGVEPWLTSDLLAAFAVRVILRVGQQGERIAAAKALGPPVAACPRACSATSSGRLPACGSPRRKLRMPRRRWQCRP